MYAFYPVSTDFSSASTTLDFAGCSLLEVRRGVSGTVTATDGVPLPGALITFTALSGLWPTPGAVVTSSDGTWGSGGLCPGGTYRATPSKSGYTFEPVSIDFSSLNVGTTLNFVGVSDSITYYTASGSVKTGDATALPGVVISFAKVSGSGTTPVAVTTSSGGGWSQAWCESGTTYRATPGKAGYTFEPSYLEFDSADMTLDFTASILPGE